MHHSGNYTYHLHSKIKVNIALEQTMRAHRGRYSSTLSLTSALDVGGWLTPRPGHFTPGKWTRYPIYKRPGGPATEIDPRNVQPVEIHYTNWDNLAQCINWLVFIIVPRCVFCEDEAEIFDAVYEVSKTPYVQMMTSQSHTWSISMD